MQGYAYKLSREGKKTKTTIQKIRFITRFNRCISFPILRFISRITFGKTFTYDYGIPFHIVYDEKDIFPLSEHLFEDILLPIPGNSDRMLQTQYSDYMQLPDLNSLQGHVSKLEFYGD